MLECSLFSFILLLVSMLLSTFAGLSLSNALPWSRNALGTILPISFGFALGPFFLGLSVIIAMTAFPKWSHSTHLLVSLFILLALGSFATIQKFSVMRESLLMLRKKENDSCSKNDLFLVFFLVLLVVFLFINILALPLIQNDPLEYATVGKILYYTRDLSVYPVVDSTISDTGFFAPWTHPPLYVALIYILDIIQGDADFPYLMKLIAPWFSLGTLLLIFGIGSFITRGSGLLAVVCFLCCPIAFLGIGDASIDSLPVAGITLILASIFGFDSSKKYFSIYLGGVLGISLWTHSIAILFIPICATLILFLNGIELIKKSIFTVFSAALCAAIISIWPYLKNLKLYGSLVSDTPVVFALQSLEWSTYFSMIRGLATPSGVLINGIFKGWTSLGSFYFIYWLATISIVLYFSRYCKTHNVKSFFSNCLNLKNERVEDKIFIMLFLLFLFYFLGVSVLTILGIDIFIKNDRYLLIMLPIMSLLCGFLYNFISGLKYKKIIKWAFGISIITYVLSHEYMKFKYLFDNEIFNIFISHRDKLSLYDSMKVIFDLNGIRDDSSVFSLRPSDMYYSKKRMISYLDPRMIEFYNIKNPEEARNWLVDNDVKYIHVPPYGIPPYINSVMINLISDPSVSRIIFYSQGSSIYQIHNSDQKLIRMDGPNLLSETKTFKIISAGVMGRIPFFQYGHKRLYNMIPLTDSYNIWNYKVENFDLDTVLNKDDALKVFYSKRNASADNILGAYSSFKVKSDAEYLFSLDLSGTSVLSVDVEESDVFGTIIFVYPLSNVVIKDKVINMPMRFKTSKKTNYIKFYIRLGGPDNFEISGPKLYRVATDKNSISSVNNSQLGSYEK